MKSVFLCILLYENYYLKAELMETKIIYRVMHAFNGFKLKISDRKKYFPCFFDNPKWSVKLSWLRPPQTMESTEKRVQNFLNFNLKRNRSRRKIFAVEKTDKSLYDDQLLVLFFFLEKFLCWMKRYSCYWYLSQWKAKPFITFVTERVPSSLIPA